MKEFYVGDYLKYILMMLDKVFMEDIWEVYDLEKIIYEEYKLLLGLDFEDVELVSLDLISFLIVIVIKLIEMEKMNDVIMFSLLVYSKN